MQTLHNTGHEAELFYLPVDKFNHNPQQPRLMKNDKKLVALAESIKIYGVLEPVLACLVGDNYTLVAGHRRLAAAMMVGLEEIPARILPDRFIDDLGAVAVTENMHRVDLNTLEVAMALGRLADTGVARKTLCEITGLSAPSISELLRLNIIPREVCMDCIEHGNTSKRFLNQLSLYRNANAISAAYRYFLEHKQLPSRQKRDYTVSKDKKMPLELLTKLNQCLKDTSVIDYLAENEIADMFRLGIGDLLENLKNHGWFLPHGFDVSNSGKV